MDIEGRVNKASSLFAETLENLRKKGSAYSDKDSDANSNFKKVAEMLGVSKYEVWSVYFMKHVISVANAIKENPYKPVDASESLKGRIIDGIGYLAILDSLLQEDGLNDMKEVVSFNRSFIESKTEYDKDE